VAAVGEITPGGHIFDGLVRGAVRRREPSHVRPADVRERVTERRPTGPGRRVDEPTVAARAAQLLVVAAGVLCEGEELFDRRAVHLHRTVTGLVLTRSWRVRTVRPHPRGRDP